ncbi:cation transport ATPase [Terriglobus roseus DSM 18391]|uniref:Cation transport ATPase n=1 Tax=Terriglobus roseus (strain DSM 18391 / NRRL B-41598 / KBS 63) TaxID=926566 RepID=I3ZDV9_TERRK|nr:cation transport ATPase [Terriglobus roseus DSM 18391]
MLQTETAESPHTQSEAEILRTYHSDEEKGLTNAQVAERSLKYGSNELAVAPSEPWWKRFGRQFADLLIWILIAAALISGALGEWVDAIAILAIVLLNGLLGFVQEGRADDALVALRKLSSPQARVIREGKLTSVSAKTLVPGDRIELETGDRVPADLRLLGAAGLRVEEAALTGESVPSDKDHRVVLDEAVPLGERSNMAYMGTSVAAGTASALVVATGMSTEIGKIAGMLERHEIEPTPLQVRLSQLGRTLLYVVVGIVAVMFVAQVARGGRLVDAFLLAVSLAVAAVPEGLSAVVTVALALGLQRMAARHALIRRLPCVETLGAVTVICSDKTGTLTRNQMTVQEIESGGERYEVTGTGYEPVGQFRMANSEGQSAESWTVVDPMQQQSLLEALKVGAWCSHTHVAQSDKAGGGWEVVGDPTEAALLVAASKAGLTVNDRLERIVFEIPFSSDRKAMSVVARVDDTKLFMFTKGAPEVVLGKCTQEYVRGGLQLLTDDRREAIITAANQMAQRSLRVLGLASREAFESHKLGETNLVFAGLAGMMDPPREEAAEAVSRCRSAGIRPVMITGDHPDTARAIALSLGIMRVKEQVMLGSDLNLLDDAELGEAVLKTSVYARVTAAHKLRIVMAWRGRSEIVAMTGDGINDAPAIKAANVGIAMGISGTDVTKEAADMVLADDNFASIVNAIEEGRTIYDNILKVVHYLLATNAGEVLLMVGAAIFGLPVPLVAIHLLVINLLTDALPAMALGVERPEPNVMQHPPRPPKIPIISLRSGLHIVYQGVLNAGVSAVAFWWVYRGQAVNLLAARTATFCTIALAQMLFALGCRSNRYTFLQLGLFTNKWLLAAFAVSSGLLAAIVTIPILQPVFQIAALPFLRDWLLVFMLALLPVTFLELGKLLQSYRAKA